MTAELATFVCCYYFYWLSCFSETYTCVYAVATEHSYCCTRLLVLLTSHCRISKFVNFEIRVFDISDRFFYTSASTFRDWFLRTDMRPRGQWVGFPHSPAIARITLSSMKLCISVIYFKCFRVLRNETLFWWFNVYCASISACIVLKKFARFCASGSFYMYIFPLFHESLEQSTPATLKMDYGFCDAGNHDGFIDPN